MACNDQSPRPDPDVVYETMIDEERRDAVLPLPMSPTMLIETPEGFDYTPGECIEWLHDADFEGGAAEPLPDPDTMVVARRRDGQRAVSGAPRR